MNNKTENKTKRTLQENEQKTEHVISAQIESHMEQSSQKTNADPKNGKENEFTPESGREAPNTSPQDMVAQMESYLRYVIGSACKNKIAPWTRNKTAEALQGDRAKKPFNPVTGIGYGGANGLALESQDKENGMWLTKKQAKIHGGKIPEDVKGIRTFFIDKEKNELRYACVYHVSDVQNLDMGKLPHHRMVGFDKKAPLDLRGINLLPSTKHQIAVYNKSMKDKVDYQVPRLPAPKKEQTAKAIISSGKGVKP